MTRIRVAVDAMGGDRAPEEVVAGALEAASADVAPVLYGRRPQLEPMAGLLEIRRLPDVHRPAIAVPLPAIGGTSVLIDAGANADGRPEHLFQFAHMGAVFAEEILGFAQPTVALLSIGEEPEKGNRLARETHALLADSGLRFRGNIESRDLLRHAADVVVCDGFTGNMALKLMEGMIKTLLETLRTEIEATT